MVPFGGVVTPGRLFDPQTFPAFTAFFGDRSYPMQIASLDAGILFVLAVSGIGILGTMLAGWSSNNKFSMLGAARPASQMISYELAMGMALVAVVVTYGTVDLGRRVGRTVGAWGQHGTPDYNGAGSAAPSSRLEAASWATVRRAPQRNPPFFAYLRVAWELLGSHR